MIGIYGSQYEMLIIGTPISILPVVVLFPLFQHESVAGLTVGAVKGWEASFVTSSRVRRILMLCW